MAGIFLVLLFWGIYFCNGGVLPNDCQSPTYNCKKYMNRKATVECPTSMQDCLGDCYDGFTLDEKSYICYAIEIIAYPPKHVFATIGSDIELQCEFNANVLCVWLKDGIEIAIGNRYQNADNTTVISIPKKNCGLRIRNFSPIDVATWLCTTTVNPSSNFVLGTHPVDVQIAINDLNTDYDLTSTTWSESDIKGNDSESGNWIILEVAIGLCVGFIFICVCVAVVFGVYYRKRIVRICANRLSRISLGSK